MIIVKNTSTFSSKYSVWLIEKKKRKELTENVHKKCSHCNRSPAWRILYGYVTWKFSSIPSHKKRTSQIIFTVVKLPFDKSVHSNFEFFWELLMINDSFYKCEARQAKTQPSLVDPLCSQRKRGFLLHKHLKQAHGYICNDPTVVTVFQQLDSCYLGWHSSRQFSTIVSQWSILGWNEFFFQQIVTLLYFFYNFYFCFSGKNNFLWGNS